MILTHGDPNRAKKQKVTIETQDGKFKYLLDMDYAKGLPEDIEMLQDLVMAAVNEALKQAEEASSEAMGKLTGGLGGLGGLPF